ncbi:hypothetical protein ACLOJK_006465, partial [Asimina triloba]
SRIDAAAHQLHHEMPAYSTGVIGVNGGLLLAWVTDLLLLMVEMVSQTIGDGAAAGQMGLATAHDSDYGPPSR